MDALVKLNGLRLPFAELIGIEFTEATTDTYVSALFEIGLVLLGVTVLVNALAQLLLKTFAGPGVKPQQ